MNARSLALQLSELFAVPEREIVAMGLRALIDREVRLAEQEIDTLRNRYGVTTEKALHQAIQEGKVAVHPAWEDYIVWKNKQAHIERLKQIAECHHTDRDG